MSKNNLRKLKPCVIGLGYVGLPLLLNLAKKYVTSGYDINKKRVKQLQKGIDIFGEATKSEIKKKKINFYSDFKKIIDCNLFIITVPTPIFKSKKPDLNHIKDVCLKLSKYIKKNDIFIFESTVYPGVTNDICIPLLQKNSKLREGRDFYVGYSPERVNPGDKKHNLKKINKILAYPYSYKKKEIIQTYSQISKKIIFTKNVKEAETAKVIENIQRDVNIGLINEIYLACNSLNIKFQNVMNLAKTKWNFVQFQPGLVGGHCLPVDPYYFATICKNNNFTTKITLAGRLINNSMANEIRKQLETKFKKIKNFKKKKVIICGLTYKRNVADIRNSLSLKIYKSLKKKFKNIIGYDPLVDADLAKKNFFANKVGNFNKYDVYVDLVSHNKIKQQMANLKKKEIISIF